MNDFTNRDKQFSQVGSVENWSVLGTFDNTSGSGYSKDWGVILTKGPFVNQVNYPIQWFTPPVFRLDRWYDFNYNFDIHNAICYAQSFVKSNTKKSAFIRAGCSGSIKVWVNDIPVIQESTERNCDLDIYVSKINLNEGFNRIVVQIGESEVNASNFLIRITDEKGNSLQDLQSVAKSQTYRRSLKPDFLNIPFEMEEYFNQLIQSGKATVLDKLVLANLLLRNDKALEARKLLKNIKKDYQNSSLVSSFLIEAYQRDKNRTDQTREVEELKKNDPESYLSLQYLISEAGDKDDIDEYERLVKEMEKKFGHNELTDYYNLSILSHRKMIPEFITKVNELYKKDPTNKLYVQYLYDIEMNQSKDLAKGNKILTKYLSKHYDANLTEKLAYNHFKLNNSSKGLEMLQTRVDNFPYATGFISDLMELYYEAGDYNTALKYCDQVLQIAPYLGNMHKMKAKIYEALKNKAKANESFQTAIKLNPKDYDSRKELRKLNNQKELYDYFATMDAKAAYRKTLKEKNKSDYSSKILIYNTQKLIYDGGASESKVELLVKVYNQQGIDSWKEYQVDYNPYAQNVSIETAEVLKKDGGTQKAETNGAQIAFTDLTPNDAIHLVYKIENYYTGKLAQHNWDIFALQYFIPSEYIGYHIIAPKDLKINYKETNGTINSSIKEIESGLKIYSWTTDNLSELKSEPYMPTLFDIAPTVSYSTIPDWKYVSSWYSDLSSELAKQDFEVKETVAELLNGKEGLPEYDKAKLFYEYIVSNISYSNIPFLHGPIIPQRASTTLRTKQGDCKDVSTLFVAMCSEAKLDANLILVNTVSQGNKHLELPGVDFNHCIAQFNSLGKKYYIELTDQKLPFASLAKEDCEALSLFIPKIGGVPSDNVVILNHSTIKPNIILRNTTVNFTGSDMHVVRNSIRSGFFASSQRNTYADLSKENQEKNISESISSDFSTPVKLKEISFKNLDNLEDSVTTVYRFEVKKSLTEVAGFKIFTIPWTDKLTSPDLVNLESRISNLQLFEYKYSPYDEEKMIINLPTGAKLQEKPQDININNSLGEYILKYDLSTPGKIIASRYMKFKKREILPNEYPDFREFINKIAEADTKPIAIK